MLLPSLPLPRTRPVILPCTIHQHHPALEVLAVRFFRLCPGAGEQSMCWCHRRQGVPFRRQIGSAALHQPAAGVPLARLQKNKHASSRLPKRSPQPIQSPPKRASPFHTTTRNTPAEPHNLPTRVLHPHHVFPFTLFVMGAHHRHAPQICYIPSQTRPVEQTTPATHARQHGRAFAVSCQQVFLYGCPFPCLALPCQSPKQDTGPVCPDLQ